VAANIEAEVEAVIEALAAEALVEAVLVAWAAEATLSTSS
jgi:hypothetical protein